MFRILLVYGPVYRNFLTNPAAPRPLDVRIYVTHYHEVERD